MSIKTDLSRAPYHDDYDPTKGDVRILHVPGASVQTRELNQVQSLIANQIEQFGDNIFKRGTIVDGCSFNFVESYPYVKILDAETDFAPADPGSYVGMFVRNSANLQAFVVNYADGFESATPDLKTLYVNYVNSGDDRQTFKYSPGDVLTIFDGRVGVHAVDVNAAGVGFSNTDKLVIVPAVVVNASSGTFANGDYVTQPSTGANLQVYWVDSTSLAAAGQVVLGLKARAADLSNTLSTANSWAVANADTIRTSTNSAVGYVERVIGVNAAGVVRTDGSGRVANVTITNRGSGYTSAPYMSIYSPGNSVGVASLQLTARNYRGRVTISGGASSVGNGYAFSIGEGTVYNRGYFIRVNPQTVVVSKYDQSPNNVVVGLAVDEVIVDSSQDTSLLDNASTDNNGAPGASRLRLIPRLEVADKDSLTPESDFFTLVGWSDGKPYRQNQKTIYSEIGDEMAARTADQTGDFVIDKFQITTKSTSNSAQESSKVDVVIDPGTAYVSGYKVQTNKNYLVSIDTSRETELTTDRVTSLEYGNWITVSEVGGIFQHATGDLISLRDTARQYVSGRSANSTVSSAGSEIGTARVRNMVYVNGTAGSATAVWRLYLFDIRMSSGKNFRDVRSVYYDGAYKGVADVVLDVDSTTGLSVCKLKDSDKSGLLFPIGVESLKNANSATYTYRTIFQDASFANNGVLTRSLSSTPGEFFTQQGTWGPQLMQSLYVVPTGGDLVSSASVSGTASVNGSSANVVGTSSLYSDLRAGDYVTIAGNTSQRAIRRVVGVVNNTLMVLDSNPGFTNATSLVYRTFPRNVPIPFGVRDGLSANVDANGNVLTLNLAINVDSSVATTTALGVEVVRRDVGPGTKTASRDRYVRLSLANNAMGVAGPWCLGVPDVFRLKGVWLGSNSSVAESGTNVTGDFYVDTNQNKDFVDLSWLYLRPDSRLSLSSASWLLVKFDHFTVSTPGFYATPSYVSANSAQILEVDSRPLANLGTSVNSHEIPEVYTASGLSIDLRSSYDFRPTVSNTAASATTAGASTINPASTISFGNTADPANDKKFPLPSSVIVADVEAYKGRVDTVVVGKDGEIAVLKGTPGMTSRDVVVPGAPRDSMQLGMIVAPAYPTITENPSDQINEIINTRRGNERFEYDRLSKRVVTAVYTTSASRQVEGFSMAKIGQMERRIEVLEYQVSMSQLETQVKNLVIPSSVDPTQERFKFGFVADTFSNAVNMDVSNPSYSAMVLNGDLCPVISLWNYSLGMGDTATSAFIDFPLVEQTYATYTPLEGETDCIDDGTITNNYLIRFQPDSSQKGRSGFEFGDYIDVESITVSNTASAMTLYFHAYSYGDYIAVYQGDTMVSNTQVAVALTDADKSKLTNTPELKPWFAPVVFEPLVIENTRFAKGSGKLTWTHDPAAGRTYTIITSKGTNSGRWRWAFEYPVGTGLLSCPTEPTTTPILYNGTLTEYVPPPVYSGGSSGGSSYSGGGYSNPGPTLDYIDILYLNTLGRLPEPEGKAFWQGFSQTNSTDSFWQNFVYEASKETYASTGQGGMLPYGSTIYSNPGTNALIDGIRGWGW